MNPVQLFEHFDRIAEAPDAMPRLRRFILDLAVRGKLVEQDPNDEPASELLKRTQAGKKTKGHSASSVAADEILFPLPAGWSATHFGEVYSLEYGDNLPADKRSNTGEYSVYGSNGIVGTHDECFVKSPCIVVGRKGSAGALNLSLADGCCVTDVAYYCIPPDSLSLLFSFRLFHTLGLDTLGKGVKPGLSRKEAYVLPIAIPPLPEQRLIVAKVEELMALCDRLEAAQNKREQRRDRLNAASLNRINQPSPSADGEAATSFREYARFHLDQLPRLTTRPEHIKALRQTILKLAVTGHLVPQDPNDDRVRDLLRKIQGRNLTLNATQRKGANRALGGVVTGRREDVGHNAILVNIGEVATKITDGTHKTPHYMGEGVKFVSAKDIRSGTLSFRACRFITAKEHRELFARCNPERGDILVSKSGSIGTVALVETGEPFSCFESLALIKFPQDLISGRFLRLASTHATDSMRRRLRVSR